MVPSVSPLPTSPDLHPLCSLISVLPRSPHLPHHLITLTSTLAGPRWTLSVTVTTSTHSACFLASPPIPTEHGTVTALVEAFGLGTVQVAVPRRYQDRELGSWTKVLLDVGPLGKGETRIEARRVEGQVALDTIGRTLALQIARPSPTSPAPTDPNPSTSLTTLQQTLDQTRQALRSEREKYRRLLSSSSSSSFPSSSQPFPLFSSQRPPHHTTSSDTVPDSHPTSTSISHPRKRAKWDSSSSSTDRATATTQREVSPSPVRNRWKGSLVNPARVLRANPAENDEFLDPDETL